MTILMSSRFVLEVLLMEVVDEIQMLGATFCGRGETVEVLSAKPWYIIRVVLLAKEKCEVCVTFELESYPSRIPRVHIHEGSLLSRSRASAFTNRVVRIAEEKQLIGDLLSLRDLREFLSKLFLMICRPASVVRVVLNHS